MTGIADGTGSDWPIVTLPLEIEDDVVHVRQCARVVAEQVGFSGQDQTRIATALSEIARNALGYAGSGHVDLLLRSGTPSSLVVRVRDRGGGIADLRKILDGQYVSKTGMGLGITGANRLMDALEVETSHSGTTVTMAKVVQATKVFTGRDIPAIADAVRSLRSSNAGAAIRDENRDLLESLAALAEREEEASRLNAELESTNRGVVALHAELERQADELRRAGETLERQVAERTRELADANARLIAEAQRRESVEADLRQAQKMEAVGQLTGGIAHDFNNLLTGVVGAFDMIGSRLSKKRYDGIEGYLEMGLASANRAAALTHRLLAFARRQPLDPKIVDVNALIEGMRDLLRRTVNEQIDLRLALDRTAWTTLCDPSQLENAILNLVINARDAMPDGGSIVVTTRNVSLAAVPIEGGPGAGDYVVASVSDTGTGMPPEVKARAFDPFFTTKPMGKGTGLGLSMIYGFARQSRGHARIASVLGEGTTIDVLLPRRERDEDDVVIDVVAAGTSPVSGGKGETVLVVEDEAAVRGLVTEALAEAGYRVLQAESGDEGLSVAARAKRLDLLVTDVGLPGLNGRQLADALRATRSDLKVLFITGYAEGAADPSGFLEPGMAMMTKPFVLHEIIARVRAMIDA